MVDRQYVSGLVKQHRVSLFIIVDAVLRSVLKCNNSVFKLIKFMEKKKKPKKKKFDKTWQFSMLKNVVTLSGQDVVHHR